MNKPAKSTGVVLWFDSAKGFGFIQNSQEQHVFFHYSDIQNAGYKTLEKAALVDYIEVETDKGLKANEVVEIDYLTLYERGALNSAPITSSR